MLHPAIQFELSRARSLNDAAAVWVKHPEQLEDFLFVISSPGPCNFHWPAKIDLDGGGFLRSVFAYDQIHFVSHGILATMVTNETAEIPVDYSIGFDVNAAQYLRRLVEGSTHDPILRFKKSLRALCHRRMNWEVFPYLEERAEDIIAGRDLENIWKIIRASERFACADMEHFANTGDLRFEISEEEVTARSQRLLSDWHSHLCSGGIERIRHSHSMVQVLLLRAAILYRKKPSPKHAAQNLADFINYMCGTVGINLPWMMWAAAQLFEHGGKFEPLKKVTEPLNALADNCNNIAWDFMHYFFRRQIAQPMGDHGAFIIPYTLTFDRGLAALFAGQGQRSCLLHKDAGMGQFFSDYDYQSEITDNYRDCPTLSAAIKTHLSIEAHLQRTVRCAENRPERFQPMLDELLAELHSN